MTKPSNGVARKLIDISRVISPEAAVYPGDDPLETSSVCEVGEESPCKITALGNWTTHFLTHVDAPCHFIEGAASLDDLDLNSFVGPAVVVEASGSEIGESDVPRDLEGRAVLFKTSNSGLSTDIFHEDHVFVSEAAVSALVAAKPVLVGIDYLSVDRFGDEDYPAHRGLLREGILILEGLDLSDVAPGAYNLAALPLKISQADGSPVRAVLNQID